jgi:hypothetical protein
MNRQERQEEQDQVQLLSLKFLAALAVQVPNLTALMCGSMDLQQVLN